MLRNIKKEEIDIVANLWVAAGLNVLSIDEAMSEIMSIIKHKGAGCLVFVKKKKILGTVVYSFNGKVGWIYRLAIIPEYQSNGVGSKLLQIAQTKLASIGAKEVMLSVNTSNLKTLTFYQKHGFSVASNSIFMKKNFQVSL
jgi:hypothetical protein